MSNCPLTEKVYRIENTWWQRLFVSSNRNEGPITGKRSAVIQAWQLIYKDGFATFRGVSGSREVKGWIYVDEAGLVYARGNNPTKFILERVDSERQDVFIVKPVNEDGSESSLIGWQLPSGEDGTQIRVSNVMIEGGEWRFTERTLAEE